MGVEAYDFKGKTVIPFATSGGSSIKKACEDLKAAYPDVNWKEGKLLNRVSKQETVRHFLSKRPTNALFSVKFSNFLTKSIVFKKIISTFAASEEPQRWIPSVRSYR